MEIENNFSNIAGGQNGLMEKDMRSLCLNLKLFRHE